MLKVYLLIGMVLVNQVPVTGTSTAFYSANPSAETTVYMTEKKYNMKGELIIDNEYEVPYYEYIGVSKEYLEEVEYNSLSNGWD